MNKLLKAGIAVVTIAFIATNIYLLYSEKSEMPKLQYVHDYERMTANDFEEKLFKETLVAPFETHTVYVGDEDAVESWLVKDGDEVMVGQELAILNTERVDGEREVWQAERVSVQEQQITLENQKSELVSLRKDANSTNTSNLDRNNNVTEVEGKTTIELGLNIGFTVDVTQEGSYVQAISAIDQQLAELSRQLEVLDAQLARDDARPALISPVAGTVSNVMRHGSSLAVDIYSEEQVVVTYVKEGEWQQLAEGQRAKIQGDSLDQVIEGEILSVSSIPSKDTELLAAYQQLTQANQEDALAYYEVVVMPSEPLENVPFVSKLNAEITIDEVFDAVAIPKGWARPDEKKSVFVTKLDDSGKPLIVSATTPFNAKERLVITEQVNPGEVVLHERELHHYDDAPQIFLSFPAYTPTKEEWKTHGWRNYLKAMLIK